MLDNQNPPGATGQSRGRTFAFPPISAIAHDIHHLSNTARTVKDTTPCILIVDDEPLNIRLLDIVLKKNGYRTLSCTSGPEARALAAEHSPDLILLDVLMPGEDGYATCELLKQQSLTSEIPVIFISALTDTSSKVRGLEVGGVDFISKPFEKAEVLARFFGALRQKTPPLIYHASRLFPKTHFLLFNLSQR